MISRMNGSIMPSTQPLLKLFYQALSDDKPEVHSNVALTVRALRECCFLFFGVMTGVFGDEFTPYISQVVRVLPVSIKQDESLCSGECFANSYLPLLNDYRVQLIRSSSSSSPLATMRLWLSITKARTPARRQLVDQR